MAAAAATKAAPAHQPPAPSGRGDGHHGRSVRSGEGTEPLGSDHPVGPAVTGLKPGRQSVPGRWHRPIELGGDAVPQPGRGFAARVGQ